LNPIVRTAHDLNPISVLNTEEEKDALNPIARRVHKVNLISVKNMEVERGAPIVLTGLIQEAEV
jgi:hypothetical protein